MSGKGPLEDAYLLGIEAETYQALLAKAKREGKSVTEVTSEALRKHLQETGVNESRERKVLCEG